MLQEGKV